MIFYPAVGDKDYHKKSVVFRGGEVKLKNLLLCRNDINMHLYLLGAEMQGIYQISVILLNFLQPLVSVVVIPIYSTSFCNLY